MAAMGQGLLLISAVLAGAAALAPLRSPSARSRRAHRTGVALLGGAAVGLVAATLILVVALVQNDFSLVYVADTSRRSMSAPYRAAALWGGMEGSLLFWTALLAGVSAITSARLARRDPALPPLAIAVPAALTSAFALITWGTANPFRLLQIPATDGAGLVPILEHPAMLYHPPLLYLGLVSRAPPFALTLGALRRGTLDAAWREQTRRLMFAPWIVLAIGMIAGANWAYVELGWGGYWAWDPIENTALLPWLAVTAFLHQSIRHGERDPSSSDLGGAALVLAAFVLAIVGTLLTRSGAASSVHAFAQATAVGRALLALVIVLTVVCLAVLGAAWRARRPITAAPDAPRDVPLDVPRDAPLDRAPEGSADAGWLGRDRLLVVHVVLVVAALTLISIGTLSPVIRSLIGGEVTAIDGSYFATMTVPLVWIGLVAMAIAPGRRPGTSLQQIVGGPALVGLLVALSLALAGWTDVVTLLTGGLAGFAGSAALLQPGLAWRRGAAGASVRQKLAAIGPHVAHAGFALLLLGIAGSTAAQSSTVLLARGQTASVDGVEVRNDGVRVDAPDSDEPKVVVAVHVQRGGGERRLEPSITGYRLLGQRLAETALWSSPAGDVQIAVRDAQDNGNALLEIHTRPLAPFVWWGGLVLVAGGVLAAASSRFRVEPGGEGARIRRESAIRG
jgi:cytochrome c-type biogenesis protein CcmF